MKIASRSHISTFELSGFFPETMTFQTETNNGLKLIKVVLERMRTLERNGHEYVLPLSSCVTMGRFFNISNFLSLYLQNGINNTHIRGRGIK